VYALGNKGADAIAIPGIAYVPGYIDTETHDRLLSAVDSYAWLTTADHRVQMYGYRYSHQMRTAFRIGDLPAWALPLATRLHHDGFIDSIPNQLVANEYPPGAGLFDHIDQTVFGDVVISISLGSTCVMRFSRSDSEDSHELLLEPASVLVFSGEARTEWKHGIPARSSDMWDGCEYPRSRRVSLTFRAVP
jgi:alkylated DNA repair dioxygenase AlkB